MQGGSAKTSLTVVGGQLQSYTSAQTNQTPDLNQIPTDWGARGRQGQSLGLQHVFFGVFKKKTRAGG